MLTADNQQAQREYIEILRKKAEEEALCSIGGLQFDPQGRVLVNVQLSEEMKQKFLAATGREPSAETTVSLDVAENAELKQAFEEKYNIRLDQFKDARGSIIPLQQEFHFHFALAARTYTQMNKDKFPTAAMNQAHKKTMKEVNELVLAAFKAAALKARKDDATLDTVKLVKELDKARKEITPKAHEIFRDQVVAATGNSLSKKEMKALHVKHTAETITATENDFLHVDESLGQYMFIEGTKVTAHDRGLGAEHLANRQIATFAIDKTKQGKPRIQVRTPSLDVKEGIISDEDKRKGKEGITKQEALDDIVTKLEHVQTRYQMQGAIEANALGNKAFTYNLLTALNDALEGGKNKQSQGADFILAGAHQYNAKQVGADDPEEPIFCFVQNISVNGFGDTLGYDGNALKTEATLMAEMAMLHNLVEAHDELRVVAVFTKYNDYLKSDPRAHYFSESQFGKEAIAQTQTIKGNWAQQQQQVDTAEPVNSAKAALKNMMANNLHQQHEFAKLFQAMSIYSEQASIAGCKSGNERAQAIAGRVAILDSAFSQNKQDDPIIKAMAELANAKPGEVVAKAEVLKQSLDQKYDRHLQSGVAAISHMDQGAAAKVNAKRGLAGLYNRNYAEESTLDHLHQNKAGAMQAHKGLTKEMGAASGPKTLGFFAYMKEKLGMVGTVLATATLAVSYPVVAVFHYMHNQAETAKFDARQERALASFNEGKKGQAPTVEEPVVRGAEQVQHEQAHGVAHDRVTPETELAAEQEQNQAKVIDFRRRSVSLVESSPSAEPKSIEKYKSDVSGIRERERARTAVEPQQERDEPHRLSF